MWEQLFTHRTNGTKFEVKHYSWNLSRIPLQGRMTTATYSERVHVDRIIRNFTKYVCRDQKNGSELSTVTRLQTSDNPPIFSGEVIVALEEIKKKYNSEFNYIPLYASYLRNSVGTHSIIIYTANTKYGMTELLRLELPSSVRCNLDDDICDPALRLLCTVDSTSSSFLLDIINSCIAFLDKHRVNDSEEIQYSKGENSFKIVYSEEEWSKIPEVWNNLIGVQHVGVTLSDLIKLRVAFKNLPLTAFFSNRDLKSCLCCSLIKLIEGVEELPIEVKEGKFMLTLNTEERALELTSVEKKD